VSNPSSSPVKLNLGSKPALLFIGLMLVLGVLIMASNGIDTRSTQRAQFASTSEATSAAPVAATPVNTPGSAGAFTALDFVNWSSPDGLVSLDRPKAWESINKITSLGSIAYGIVVPGSADTGIVFQANVRSAYPSLSDSSANSTARSLLRSYAPNIASDQIEDATISGLPAATFKTTVPGASGDIEAHLWLVKLDNDNILLLQIQGPATDSAALQTVIDRVIKSAKIDVAGIAAALTKAAPAATPAATEAVIAATPAATETAAVATAEAATPTTAPTEPAATATPAATEPAAATATPAATEAVSAATPAATETAAPTAAATAAAAPAPEGFVAWASPKNLIVFNAPKDLVPSALPAARGPLAFDFTAAGAADPGIELEVNPRSFYPSMSDTSASTTPFGLMRAYSPDTPRDDIQELNVNNLPAATFKTVAGKNKDLESHVWLVRIDNDNILVLKILGPAADSAKLQATIDEVLKSLKIDAAGIATLLTAPK